MYLGIDIGGTKTLVASLDRAGVIREHHKFPTIRDYSLFLKQLHLTVDKLSTHDFVAVGVGAPSRIDRSRGIALAFGNLPWRNVPLQADIHKMFGIPAVIENDANLAGLSEAMLVKDYQRVLYVTISTGIGAGYIVGQQIDASMADNQAGHMLVEHHGKLVYWESFASGRAIYNRFGKHASEITDKQTWQIIAHDIAVGLIDLIALMEPQIIIFGGGVGAHFDKFKPYLEKELAEFETPLLTIPVMKQAERPVFAVLYGCYDLARQTYGKAA